MANQYDDTLFKIVSPDFKQHLEENSRIVFSAKFGKGKTTFLKEIFQHQKKYFQEDKYEAIHLFPVNYAVAANEDIFRYIKYDIIIDFLKKDLALESFDWSFTEKVEWFAYQKPLKILANILSFVPKVGMTLAAIKDAFEKIKPEFEKWESEIKENFEGDVFLKYIEEIEKTEGLIYENDFITKFIEKCIEKLKGNEEDKKEVVLIIDDLDRIDPEHIFRILNVFAAHFDNPNYNNHGKENKFGFDKVIVVCDYNNLKSIFYHRYGVDTDFIGYISKFYSKSIFDCTNSIENFIDSILPSLKFGPHKESYNSMIQNTISLDLNDLVCDLYKYDFISLRELLSLKNIVFKEFYSIIHSKKNTFFNNDIFIPIQLYILRSLCGGYNNLVKGLSFLREKQFFINKSSGFKHDIYNILYVNTIPIHNQDEITFKYTYHKLHWEVTINYSFSRTKRAEIKDFNNNSAPYQENIDDYYTLLLHLCEQLHRSHYL